MSTYASQIKNIDGLQAIQGLAGNHFERVEPLLLKANQAFSKGAMVKYEYGRLVPAATSDVDIVGVIKKAYTAITNPAARAIKADITTSLNDTAFAINITNYIDFTATGGTATTITAANTDIAAVDNQVRGAIIYCYEGPLFGQERIIKTYDFDAGGDTITVEEAYAQAPTTADKFIIVGDSNTVSPIAIGKRGAIMDSTGLLLDCSVDTSSSEGQMLVVGSRVDIGQLIVKIYKNNQSVDAS